MENIYVQFDGMVYQQIVGIPMGTNCAPLIADLFLYCYERDFMTSVLPVPVLPVRAPGHLQLDLLAVFDVTFEGLIDQQSVTEDSTRPSFFEHTS